MSIHKYPRASEHSLTEMDASLPTHGNAPGTPRMENGVYILLRCQLMFLRCEYYVNVPMSSP